MSLKKNERQAGGSKSGGHMQVSNRYNSDSVFNLSCWDVMSSLYQYTRTNLFFTKPLFNEPNVANMPLHLLLTKFDTYWPPYKNSSGSQQKKRKTPPAGEDLGSYPSCFTSSSLTLTSRGQWALVLTWVLRMSLPFTLTSMGGGDIPGNPDCKDHQWEDLK